MNKKLLSCVTLLVCLVSLAQAKTAGTLVGRFEVEPSELQGAVKTFVNKSNRDLAVRWTIREKESGKFYTQEPILKKNSRIRIDVGAGLNQLLQSSKGSQKYEFSLELLRVKQMPKGDSPELKTSRLKDGEYALQINKAKFVKNDVHTLSRNKNGLLIYEVGSMASA